MFECCWCSRQESENWKFLSKQGFDICLLNETRLESDRALGFANRLKLNGQSD
jgi:hypothetical protein